MADKFWQMELGGEDVVKIRDERNHLRACNAELLAALEKALPRIIEAEDGRNASDRIGPQIRAVIAKAHLLMEMIARWPTRPIV